MNHLALVARITARKRWGLALGSLVALALVASVAVPLAVHAGASGPDALGDIPSPGRSEIVPAPAGSQPIYGALLGPDDRTVVVRAFRTCAPLRLRQVYFPDTVQVAVSAGTPGRHCRRPGNLDERFHLHFPIGQRALIDRYRRAIVPVFDLSGLLQVGRVPGYRSRPLGPGVPGPVLSGLLGRFDVLRTRVPWQAPVWAVQEYVRRRGGAWLLVGETPASGATPAGMPTWHHYGVRVGSLLATLWERQAGEPRFNASTELVLVRSGLLVVFAAGSGGGRTPSLSGAQLAGLASRL